MRWTMAAMLALCFGLAGSLCLPAQAQDKPKNDEKKTEADPFTSTVEMRFESLMFVDVMVNGKGPYNFLFDSGASITILGERLAAEQGLTCYESPMGGAQGVGTQDMMMTIVESVKLGGFERDGVLAGVMNLDHISGELGKHMMGIIGQNMITRMKRIHADFDAGTLSVTRFKAGEGPRTDMQEMMMKMLLRNAEGTKVSKEYFEKRRKGEIERPEAPELPGMPRMPRERPPEREKPKEKPPEKTKEEEFSVRPGAGLAFLAEGEAPANTLPTEAIEFKYDGLKMMGMEVAALWFMEAKINGATKTLFFDTGASSLCVLNREDADAIGVPLSYSYPVKGVGSAEAYEGMLESIEIGGLKIHEPTCGVMDLSGALGQIKQLGSECVGIIGIPIATRFKAMTVDGVNRKVTLTPHEKGAEPKINPLEDEALMKKAVLNTWNRQAGAFNLSGDSVNLDDWEALGVKEGAMKVTTVGSGGAAAKAGLKEGDLIVKLLAAHKNDEGKLEDIPVRGYGSLLIWGLSNKPGTEVRILIKRDGKEQEIKLTLADYGWSGDFPAKFKRK